jgi:hypothetical protein
MNRSLSSAIEAAFPRCKPLEPAVAAMKRSVPAVVGLKKSRRHMGARMIAAIPLSLLLGTFRPVSAAADPLFGPPLSFGTGFYPYSVAIGDPKW